MSKNMKPQHKSNQNIQAQIQSIIDARLNKENTQMAREMLEEGLDYGLISKVTGFDEKAIAALSQK